MPTTLEQLQYRFDRDSRRTWQKRPLTSMQDQQYNYDALSQVNAAARGSLNLNATAISGIPALEESWNYDPTGNWSGYHTAANGEVTLDQHRVHDRGNRLTQIEDNPNNMILDRAGRMRQMAPDAGGDWDGTLELTWDAWSRITSVKNNGAVVGEYAYDGQHRRTTREVDGETLHSYYNDAWRPVEERKDAETTASNSYLWGSRHRDDLVRRDRAVAGTALNEMRYVLMDYFNPSAITDEEGEVTERYEFSAFGVRTILNPDLTVRSSSESGMEFAFQEQFLDVDSGLMNYGYRYYSPQLGRWPSRDPIGERGGINLYGMVGNDSVNLYDRLGLDPPGKGLNGPYGCCDSQKMLDGLIDLKKQAEKIKQGFADGSIKAEPDGSQSCKINHSYLINNLKVPRCWKCRKECGGATLWRIATYETDGWRDHCVVICKSKTGTGADDLEIILDITGGFTDPDDWRRVFSKPHEDTDAFWTNGK